jgi:hypothetical protein
MKKQIGFCWVVLWAGMGWGQGTPLKLDSETLDTSSAESQERFQKLQADPRTVVVQQPTSRGTVPWLVQFVDSVREEWRVAVESAGGVLKGEISENAVWVEATPEQIQEIAVLPDVMWAGEYLPDYKSSPAVRAWQMSGSGETQEIDVLLLRSEDRVRIGRRMAELKGAYVTATESRPDGARIQARLPLAAIARVTGWGEVVWVEFHGGNSIPASSEATDGDGP